MTSGDDLSGRSRPLPQAGPVHSPDQSATRLHHVGYTHSSHPRSLNCLAVSGKTQCFCLLCQQCEGASRSLGECELRACATPLWCGTRSLPYSRSRAGSVQAPPTEQRSRELHHLMLALNDGLMTTGWTLKSRLRHAVKFGGGVQEPGGGCEPVRSVRVRSRLLGDSCNAMYDRHPYSCASAGARMDISRVRTLVFDLPGPHV